MKKVSLLFMMFLATWGFSQNAPIDFETGGFGATWTWSTFQPPAGQTVTFSVVANPNTGGINTSANVGKIDVSFATTAVWGEAGAESQRGADLGVFQFDSTNSFVKVMVYQEVFASPVALKFADAMGGALPEVIVPNTVADQWVEITFDMSAWITSGINNPEQIIFYPSYGPRNSGHVVYFDNVTFNPIVVTPPPSGPTTSAPDPTRPETDVLSVYSNFYMDSTVQNFNFNVFAGGVTVTEVDIQMDGNLTGKLENLDFYGGGWDAEDVSGYDFVHLDYYVTTSTAFNFYLIDATAMIPGGNPEEPRYAFATTGGDETLVAGQWVSVDIPLSHFTNFPTPNFSYDLNDIFQYKFDGNGTVYFDNVYFFKGGSGVTDPMTSAPDPTIDEEEVLSVYSNTYMDSTVLNFNFNAFQGAVTVSEVDIEMDGNLTGKLENIDFYGAGWDAEDVSGYNFVHLDYYATTSTAFNFYLIDQTAMIPGGNPEEPRYAIADMGGDETLVTGQWVSVFIPLTHFTSFPTPNFSYDLNDIFQYKFDGNGTVYFDNIYFVKDTTTGGGGVMDPMTSAPDPTIDESKVLSVYSNTYMDSTVLNFNFNAFQGGMTVSEVDIEMDGNLTGKLENIDFYGAQWDAEDVTGYNYVHLDYYATTSTAFNFYLIDQTAMIPGGNPEEPRYAFAETGGDETLQTGQWVSVFIPLTHFTNFPTPNFSYDLTDIFQYKFDGNGTVYFDNIYFTTDIASSVDGINTTSIRAFPNPTKDSWNLQVENTTISSVQLFDLTGKNVLSVQGNNANQLVINSSALKAGLYIARVNTPAGIATKKLIKE